MKNINIKTFLIPSFFIEAIELHREIDTLGEKLKSVSLQLEKHKAKIREWETVVEAIFEFRKIIQVVFPEEFKTPVIQTQFELMHENETITELKESIATILFILYFSKGEDKIFDLQNNDFFDDEKCQKLFDQEIYISENWLDQFIRCLKEKNANEDMILHSLTPDWMWPKCFRILLELYTLTQESFKNIHK